MRANDRKAFTLVELLVVITIIAILVALLLPAVQSAREAARCAHCSNNLKQLSMGVLQHVEKYGHYPSGGWGWGWCGDADRGHGLRQPGGWLYNILPFIEQTTIYMLTADGKPDTITAEQREGGKILISTVLAMANCPTRRRSVAFPYHHHQTTTNFDVADQVTRTDYASNGGTVLTHAGLIKDKNNSPIWSTNCLNTDGGPKTLLSEAEFRVKAEAATAYGGNGIDYPMSRIQPGHIRDGEMCTIMFGEKYLNPAQQYAGGGSWGSNGDNENMYSGHNEDNVRWTNQTLLEDRHGYDSTRSFGSSHSAGIHMAFCDGHVKRIQYNIDTTVFLYLGSRADGKHPDMTKF